MSEVRNLKVEPAILEKVSGQLRTAIGAVERDFVQMADYIEETRNYWKGEAAEHHRGLYDRHEREIQDLLKDLKRYPDDLLRMAGMYKKAGGEANTIANKLISNIVHK